MTGRSLAVRRVCGLAIGVFLNVLAVHVFSGHVLSRYAFGGEEAAGSLPRYKLEVGQQIQYAGSGAKKYDDGRKSRSEEQWEFDVLSRNTDGNCRLLYRLVKKQIEIDNEGKDAATNETREIALVNMDPAGNMTELFGSFGYRSDPEEVFPPLPADAKQLTDGWQGPGSFGSTMHYQALPESNAKEFVFSKDEESQINVVYDLQRGGTVTFDKERGLPSQCTTTRKQGWGIPSQGSLELKLAGVQMHNAEWAAKLKADAELFFSTKERFSRATDDDKATPELLDEAVGMLKQTREKISSAELQQQIDREIESFEQYRKYSEEQLANRNAMIGRPAEDFKTTDLKDKPQALADYRGKVVVLDFWYRGCGWCMRAMPALEKVAEHYKDQPVVVLGMNTDQNIEDAKFVIEKLGVNYATLKAEGLPEKFKVRGFPTFIVIDQTGVIREISPGWSATLEPDLIKQIDKLLAESK
jgi:thiol-disulfide isomerase/thioredoxin